MTRIGGLRAILVAATAAILPACGGGGSSGGPVPGVIGFASAAFSAGESDGTATITVSRAIGSLGAVSVAYAASNGSAGAGDFTATSGFLSWADGEGGNKTFAITLAGDSAVEGAETVLLSLSSPSGGATLGISSAVLTLADDDAPTAGVLQLSAATYSVNEAGGQVTIVATRSGGSTGAVSVTIASANGTATAGSDYVAIPGASSLAWLAGDTADKSINVAVTNDALVEGPQTFTVTLSAPTNGAVLGSVSSAVVTIVDDDSPGTIALASATYSVSETGGNAAITLTRTGGSGGTVGVTIASSNGTATAGADYTAIPGATTVSWGPGDTSTKVVLVPITEDAVVEGDETVNVAINTPTGGAALGTAAAVLTILDDDCSLQLSAATYSQSESGTTATITVTRTGGTTSAVGVSFASTAGTATVATDYTEAGGTLAWAAGDGASKTFTVTIAADTSPEGDETVNLAISTPTGVGAVLGAQTSAVLTIVDDDVSFVFSASSYSGGETGTILVTVNRVGATAGAASVTLGVTGGTAGDPADYTIAGGVLNWADGDADPILRGITVAADTLVEGDETILLALSAPTIAAGTAVVGTPGTATATIVDDDVHLQLSSATYGVVENVAGGTVTITVNRVGLTAPAVSVNWSVATGTAGAADFASTASGTLNFASGDTSETFTVAITDDFDVEGNEDFTVSLDTPGGTGASLGTPSSATVTITENDTPGQLNFSSPSYTVGESGVNAVITVTRTGGVGNTVTADVSTVAGGSATAGADYTVVTSQTVTFPAGSAVSQTVNIPITQDSDVEPNETVNLFLDNPTGGATTAFPTDISTLTINDDDVILQFAAASSSAGEAAGTATINVRRIGRTSGAVSVNWSVTGGTAASPADFTPTSGTVSWDDGITADQPITITIVNDDLLDGDRTVIVTLDTPMGTQTTLGAPVAHTLTIQEDDAPGTVEFTASASSANEGNANAVITATRTGGTGGAVSVNFTITGGSASGGGTDYNTPPSFTFSWAAGDGANKSLTIPLVADSLSEGTETILVALDGGSLTPGASLGSTTSSTVNIIDAPGTLSFTFSNYNVNESDGTVTLTVTRMGGRGGMASVNWATSANSAQAASDYVNAGNTLSWANDEDGPKDIVVSIVNDMVGETTESFNVDLSAAVAASVSGPFTASVTIADDDRSFRFTASTETVAENAGSVVVTVERIGVTTNIDTVSYQTVPNSATAPDDYVAHGLTLLTFLAGETSKDITITIENDSDIEGTRDFSVALSLPGSPATLAAPSTITVTITEDDAPGTLQFSAVNFNVNENVGAGTVTVTVERVGGTGGNVSVNYATANGTATVPAGDYTNTTGTLSWLAGDATPQTFTVPITNDTIPEDPETFFVTLNTPTNGATAGGGATVTIIDNDATMVLSSSTYSVDENTGTGWVSITIRRLHGTVGAVTVGFDTTDGSAIAGSDYTALSSSVIFADGSSADRFVLVPITNDTVPEGLENFTFTLSIDAGTAVVGTPGSAVVTIVDDEGPQVMSFTPTTGELGVELDAHVVITFSEAMDTASTEAAVSITRDVLANPLPTAEFVWSAGDTVLTVVFDTAAPSGTIDDIHGDDLLAEATQYTVTVGTGAMSAGMEALSAQASTSFTTLTDATRPTITSINPDITTTVIAAGTTQIDVNFSEAMDQSSGWARIRGSGFEKQDDVNSTGSVGMSVDWFDNDTLRITLSPGLPGAGGFELELQNLVDLLGNWHEGENDYIIVTTNPAADTTQPRVTGSTPRNGATGVDRDGGIFIAFTEFMQPDLATKVTVSPAVAVRKDYHIDDFGGLLTVMPEQAWPAGTVTITIDCDPTTGAKDADGNRLTPNSGSNYVISFTTVAGSAAAMVIDDPGSAFKDGLTLVDPWSQQLFLRFNYASTTTRAYTPRGGVPASAVRILDTVTGVPVKGQRVEIDDESGGLTIRRDSNKIGPLEYGRVYNVTLTSSLVNSRGVAFTPVTYDFTTSPSDGARPLFVRAPFAEFDTFFDGINTETTAFLEGQVQNQAATMAEFVTVDVEDSPDSGFNPSIIQNPPGESWFQFDYETPGSAEASLNTGGIHTLTFTASDSLGHGTNTITDKAYRFPSSELGATLTVPAGATPTYSWSWPGGIVPSSADILIVYIEDDSTQEGIAQFFVDSNALSFTHPADRPLPAGDYTFYLGIIRFKDRVITDGGVDFGINEPVPFTVP